MPLVRLPWRVCSRLIYQTPIQTGSFAVWFIFAMAIAKDQVTALFVEIIVMLPRDAVPFAGTGAGERVPLSIGIFAAAGFRLIPDRIHQTECFLDHDCPSGVMKLAYAFIDNKLAKENIC